MSDLPPPDEADEPDETVEAVEGVEDDDARRYPSTIGGAFYLIVLAITAIGIGIVITGAWRVGVRWMAGALLFGALVRAVLPARDAGMLAVRRRWWDCVLLAGVGIALLLLAGTIPDQPL